MSRDFDATPFAPLAGSPGRRPLPALRAPLLLVVDCQRLFCDPTSPAFVAAWPAAAVHLRRLSARFARRGWPIVRTRHVLRDPTGPWPLVHFLPRPIRPEDSLSELIEFDDAIRNAPVVEKAQFDAFADGRLADLARVTDAVILVGVQTHRCILATALGAARRGILPIVVADACAAPTAASHAAALGVLSAGHAQVASTAEVLAHLTEAQP